MNSVNNTIIFYNNNKKHIFSIQAQTYLKKKNKLFKIKNVYFIV